ncbi:MAG: phosphoenolpyruvate carboxykinase (ATP) [Peptostreptococcales bacterium]
MSTKSNYLRDEISINNKKFSSTRSTLETLYYGNNVVKIKNLTEAYELAAKSPGTVVTDMPVYQPKQIGLPEGAKVLLFNDGETTGRFAGARRILGEKGVDTKELDGKLREAAYYMRYKKLYHTETYIGLDKDFMVKAHLLIPEGHENILYNWMLNFQYKSDEYNEMYKQSKELDETDIIIVSDPDWTHKQHGNGLCVFDSEHNCAAILGMRYFGEHKKGTLTLAWGIASRNNYVSCHGGLKKYNLENDRKYVMGVFGLSGSGKSTITHAKHDGKYDITVVHDDAYIISTENGSSVALEPTYFDKTQDYPLTEPANKFLITVQNCGACLDEDGKCVLVTEDIRNGNGRAIKSKLWAPNRVDKLDEPINAIVWIMKDPTLPPILKINNPVLAATMGATLATKRTSAEKILDHIDINALVIEPYANPFRTYPLIEDYNKFKLLFEKKVDCYILNTGHFTTKKVPKEVTLEIIEKIIENEADFNTWGSLKDFELFEIEGFVPEMKDSAYLESLKRGFKERVGFLDSRKEENGGRDMLPDEAINSIEKVIDQIDVHRKSSI